jgi:hypothetical protein
MEPTIIQLPTLLAALMFGAMLAVYSQVVAFRHKGRDDRRRYQRRMRRNHGEPRQQRETPPPPT